ncbi:acyl carrier protein [Streptomyces sp. GMR22]|nr:acyl carrier protein [Streptomyces sp. GMR22]
MTAHEPPPRTRRTPTRETHTFVEEHEADSLRAIEILARIEKKYKIDIPQSELPRMENLKAVHDVVATQAGRQD